MRRTRAHAQFQGLSGAPTAGISRMPGMPTKVVLNAEFTRELGREAARALASARGLQLSGAVDPELSVSGRDLGEVAGLAEPLELPIMSDPVMVLASVAQSRESGVYVDLTGNPEAAFENVRQAVAFGLRCVVGECAFSPKQLNSLLEFCDKASMGCLVAPTLSLGAVLLQQASLAMAFHYSHCHIIESSAGAPGEEYPSALACRLAEELSSIGRTFNDGDSSEAQPARGAVVGEAGRVHSMRQPGLLSSLDVRFAAPGQVLSLRLDCADARALVPGLLLAIRRAPRLKGLVYGLEKVL